MEVPKYFKYTPRTDTFSNGFGRNQIKRYINRVLQRNNDQMIQMMKRIEALEDLAINLENITYLYTMLIAT